MRISEISNNHGGTENLEADILAMMGLVEATFILYAIISQLDDWNEID